MSLAISSSSEADIAERAAVATSARPSASALVARAVFLALSCSVSASLIAKSLPCAATANADCWSIPIKPLAAVA